MKPKRYDAIDITTSFQFKLLILAIVLILWGVQSMMKQHNTEIQIPVRFRNLDERLIVMDFYQSHSPSDETKLFKVSVLVEGKGLDIYRLTRQNNYVEVDARDFRYGPNEIVLTDQQLVFQNPLSRSLIAFHLNETFTVKTDLLITKDVPINGRFLTLEDDLYFQQIKAAISPSKVRLTGGKSIVDKIKNVTTIPLTSAIIDNPDSKIEIEIPENVVSVEPETVSIDLELPTTTTNTISLIKIQVTGTQQDSNSSISLIPQYVTVRVEGTADLVQSLKPNNIKAYIQVPADSTQSYANISIEMPAGVTLLEYTPMRVQVIRKLKVNNE